MDNSGIFAIVLLVVSLALLLAEVFIPSGGLILVMAIVSLVGSIWFAYRAWWDDPVLWWAYIASIVIVVPASVGGLLYWFPRTTMGKRILLEAPDLADLSGYNEEQAQLQQLVGKTGKSLTLMNPGGMVLVNGGRYHSESQGLMIEPGEPIEVVGISGNRLVVRQSDATAAKVPTNESAETPPVSAPAEETPDTQPTAADDRALDFEVPQS